MFLKSLTIENNFSVIRYINFHEGINLIVDETSSNEETKTGNNVGKTTVLKLIDFCLGGKAKNIYADPENKNNHNRVVKDFLIDTNVRVRLILSENLKDPLAREIVLERNFLSGKNSIRSFNEKKLTEDEYNKALTEILFPGHYGNKPTFRQIISHNIRYNDLNINNTLKTLDAFTKDEEYESLYLFLLGCNFENGNTKQELLSQIKTEAAFKARLERDQTKSAYEAALDLLEREIFILNKRKSSLNINNEFESDLKKLNEIKYNINLLGSEISKSSIRRKLIKEAETDIRNKTSFIDEKKIKLIYSQAKAHIGSLQKSFEDLQAFHNKMIEEKARFIAKEIPILDQKIITLNSELTSLIETEKQLAKKISLSDSFEDLERLILEINEKYQKKGEYESTIKQLNETEENLSSLTGKLAEIDNGLFSDNFQKKVKEQLRKFNEHFAQISYELYGEQYALKEDISEGKNNKRIYKFSSFNTNFSSGKKQGEISCFDIAYTHFADKNGIPCMHFLLNDKKELMHDNQLLKIADHVNKHGPQFVASILRDKLPSELDKEENIVLKLSPSKKLFMIENQ